MGVGWEERSFHGTIQARSKDSARVHQKGARDKIRKASMKLSWRLILNSTDHSSKIGNYFKQGPSELLWLNI